jgi:hypothetical protein
MGAFLLMLLVAMFPSGNYNWDSDTDTQSSSSPRPSDYAICYLGPTHNVDGFTMASVVLSQLLIGIGFLVRIVRLHSYLSVSIVGAKRNLASEKARKLLRSIYKWCDVETFPRGLKRLFVYRPMLAVFLASRIIVDVWSSMFLEASMSTLLYWLPGPIMIPLTRPTLNRFGGSLPVLYGGY